MLITGDKIKLVKSIGSFEKVGDVYTITNITEDGTVTFSCGYGCGVMSLDEFENHFEKYVEVPKTTEELLAELLDRVNDLEYRVEELEDESNDF